MKFKIQLGQNDTLVQIPITSQGCLSGYDDDVESMVTDETDASINNVSDAEVRRFLPDKEYELFFNFTGNSGYVTYLTPNEITGSTTGVTYDTAVKNSFFVVQVYDGFKEETQNKKHTGYFNGYEFFTDKDSGGYISQYTGYTADMEFSNFYLPINFFPETGSTNVVFYAKFMYYSAISGKFYVFFNGTDGDTPPSSQGGLYFALTADTQTMQYSFGPTDTLTMFELVDTAYTTFVNNTVTSTPLEKPNYPTGTRFTLDGTYI